MEEPDPEPYATCRYQNPFSQSEECRGYLFTPTAGVPETGFILYPGAGVDPRPYAPTAQAVAREGYLVAIVPMKDMLAFNGVGALPCYQASKENARPKPGFDGGDPNDAKLELHDCLPA